MSDSDWLTVYGKIKTKWKNMIYCQNYILENVFSVNTLALKSVIHTLLTPLNIKNRGNFLTKIKCGNHILRADTHKLRFENDQKSVKITFF